MKRNHSVGSALRFLIILNNLHSCQITAVNRVRHLSGVLRIADHPGGNIPGRLFQSIYHIIIGTHSHGETHGIRRNQLLFSVLLNADTLIGKLQTSAFRICLMFR